MILPFLLALLAFAALLPILAPLLRGSRPAPTRASFDQAVYRDQLLELDRDIARGLVTPVEADSARLEIQRRLLASDKQAAPPPRLTRSPALAAIVFIIVASGSLSFYLWLGAPEVPDEPYASRAAELAAANRPTSLQQAIDALADRLKQNPSDGQGWQLYGRSLAMLRQWDKAEDAYRRAIALGQTSPAVLADHAEVLVMQAGGSVTPAAEAQFQQVLKADPGSAIARYYLAVAALQAGEPEKAIDGFQGLLAMMPADSPLRTQIGAQIAQAALSAGIPTPELAKGTPSAPAAKVAADSAGQANDQQQAMIRGMVASLAAKQEANPSNLDGWLRLGHAYAVLHETDKAADAYEKAVALKPDDHSIPLQEVQALLQDHAPTDKLSPRVIAVLQHIQATDPDEPLVLWYLGMAAVQDGHPDEARGYWSKLLTKLPAGSENAKMIQSAVEALGQQQPGK